MSATKPEKLNKLLSYAMIHIHVGNNLKDFGVHKYLACHHSPYFKAALYSGLEEITTGIIKFPEVKVEVFELFYHWLYSQDFITFAFQLKLLSKLYVFAGMTQIPVLQNYCIEKFHVIVNLRKRVPVELIEYIWGNTMEHDRLHKLIIDMMLWETAPEFSLFVPNPIPTLVLDEVYSTMRKYFRAAVHETRGA
ncbi:uncharacterized protein EAF02_001733 [Botrytis sinoallii]|uniref:uncharacterized protein n=1 Tax=Botrytis sinoallii TaxID=1463999 RepID=UPI0018FFF501|nr:uncharacterized protein EAF02_001733 [Botrytis sinoallii]KAF7891408.1 hypothetical protein EAF02_001733 [Botrytis sinoallii]